MRWRSIVSSWASRRYRGRHRSGIPFTQVAAGLRPSVWDVLAAEMRGEMPDFTGDDCVTQIIPTPNVVRRADTFDVPTVEFARVPAWTVTL